MRTLRLRADLTVTNAARIAGVTPVTWRNWERTAHARITGAHLAAIQRRLHALHALHARWNDVNQYLKTVPIKERQAVVEAAQPIRAEYLALRDRLAAQPLQRADFRGVEAGALDEVAAHGRAMRLAAKRERREGRRAIKAAYDAELARIAEWEQRERARASAT